MSVVRDVIERLRALVFRRRLDRELDDELAFHLEREIAERARDGNERSLHAVDGVGRMRRMRTASKSPGRAPSTAIGAGTMPLPEL